jgi:hypothetical protein
MTRSLDQRTHDHAVLSELVVELAQEASAAGEMTDDVVELVCELERLMGMALGLKSPAH